MCSVDNDWNFNDDIPVAIEWLDKTTNYAVKSWNGKEYCSFLTQKVKEYLKLIKFF